MLIKMETSASGGGTIQEGTVTTSISTSYTDNLQVNFDKAFNDVPKVGVRITSGGGQHNVWISNVTKTGFTYSAITYNSSARTLTFDWVAYIN
jgi:hypothetical protein